MKRKFTKRPKLNSAVSTSRPRKNSKSINAAMSADEWSELKNQLMSDCDMYYDPLYEQTSAGGTILDICAEVEESLGVWLEPSVQGGVGGIWVYRIEDDRTVATDIDYESYNSDILNLAASAGSEEEFRREYKTLLEGAIESHPYDPNEYD